jgi:hypothetical protein
VLVAMEVLALVTGVYTLWAQHSGVPAAVTVTVTVTECHTVGTKYHEQECTGRWSDGSGSRTVWIDSAGTPRVGQVDQMRIQGGKAYTQST